MTNAEKKVVEELRKAELKRQLRADHELPMYSVRVNGEGIFNPPFCYPNDQMALRKFTEWKAEHPEAKEYILYRLGSYNMIDGKVTSLSKPMCVYNPISKSSPKRVAPGKTNSKRKTN